MKLCNKTKELVRLITAGEIVEISPEETVEFKPGDELILEYVDRKPSFEVVKKTGYGRRRRKKRIVYYQCRAKYIVSKLVDDVDEGEDYEGYDIRSAMEDSSLVFHASVGYSYPTISYKSEGDEEIDEEDIVLDDYDRYWLSHQDPDLLEFCDKNEHNAIAGALRKRRIPSILAALVSVPIFAVCYYLNRTNESDLSFIKVTALILMILAFSYFLTNHFTLKKIKKYSTGNKLNISK